MKSNPLIINGSPNKNGNSMQVARAVFNEDHDDIIHAYEVNVHPCDDCKICHIKEACKYKDDMQIIKSALKKTDTLILVSPIYFGALTDQLMRIINRFQQLFEAKFTHQKPFTTIKNIYLVSTAASVDQKMFQGASLTIDILASLFGAEQVEMLTLGGTDTIEDIVGHYQDTITRFKNSI